MITAIEFEQKMKDLLGDLRPTRVAVAVSGGADSLCLTFLLSEWSKKNNVQIYAFTVDHGLRKESADEAKYVHQLLTQKGIKHQTLLWTGINPAVSVEEKARQARYDLLFNACRKNKIEYLCLAHHQNDQAETFWLRLIRSSGVDGLSAMHPSAQRQGIFLLRPLLDFSRAEIQKTLTKRFNVGWVEDPSNQQRVFERVRLRQFQNQLDELGLTASAVALSAKRLMRARNALEWMTNQFMESCVKKSSAGFVFVSGKAFAEQPQEIQLRILDKCLAYVVGQGYIPRMSQLESFLQKMPCRLTLNDCQVVCVKKGFYVCPELVKMPKSVKLKPSEPITWGRFDVVCDKAVTVAPLMDAYRPKGLPALVRRTIPAFFDKKGLAFIPALDYKRENTYINGSIQIKE